MIKKSTFVRFLITVTLTIIAVLVLKNNDNFKTSFYKYVYNDNLSFATINNWYQAQFGSPLPFSKYFDAQPVFNESLKYQEANLYKDGVSLKVGNNYMVPSIDGGIVIFIGEKEGYGKTVIVEQANGITVWYSNLSEVNLKMYDYLTKGSYIGEANEFLYLVFYKEGEVIDYQEYI